MMSKPGRFDQTEDGDVTVASDAVGAECYQELKSGRPAGKRRESFSPPARQSWPVEELAVLRQAVCRAPPAASDAYWKSNTVWVGCTEVDVHDGCEKDSEFSNLKVKIKVVSRGDVEDSWAYYQRDAETLRRQVEQAATGGHVRIVDLKIYKGSVTLVLIISIVKITSAVGALVLGVMTALANYDKSKAGFNDARVDCKAFIDKVIYRVSEFFGGLGRGLSTLHRAR